LSTSTMARPAVMVGITNLLKLLNPAAPIHLAVIGCTSFGSGIKLLLLRRYFAPLLQLGLADSRLEFLLDLLQRAICIPMHLCPLRCSVPSRRFLCVACGTISIRPWRTTSPSVWCNACLVTAKRRARSGRLIRFTPLLMRLDQFAEENAAIELVQS